MDNATRLIQVKSPRHRSSQRYALLLPMALLLACSITVQAQTPTPTPGIPQFRIDHFLCYHVNPPQFAGPKGLSVIDQFNVQPPLPVQVNGRDSLCNPVSKNGEPILNKERHLFGYLIRVPKNYKPVNKAVIVSNQFGEDQRVTVLRPVKLLLPTGKVQQIEPTKAPQAPPIPANFDHYFCYTVKAEFKPRAVTIQDQFDNEAKRQVEAIDFALLCNPAEKREEGKPPGHMFNNRDHLACYTLRPTEFKPRAVLIHNQFEERRIEAVTPSLLCVPSLKRLATGK